MSVPGARVGPIPASRGSDFDAILVRGLALPSTIRKIDNAGLPALPVSLSRENSVPASSVSTLSRQWVGCLAHYRRHRNDEHREALIEEALRYTGFHLESDLTGSAYWAQAPLARRVAVLLFLVDRGVVTRTVREGRIVFEVDAEAEAWALSQPALTPYLDPTLELIAALRRSQTRRGPRASR